MFTLETLAEIMPTGPYGESLAEYLPSAANGRFAKQDGVNVHNAWAHGTTVFVEVEESLYKIEPERVLFVANWKGSEDVMRTLARFVQAAATFMGYILTHHMEAQRYAQWFLDEGWRCDAGMDLYELSVARTACEMLLTNGVPPRNEGFHVMAYRVGGKYD